MKKNKSSIIILLLSIDIIALSLAFFLAIYLRFIDFNRNVNLGNFPYKLSFWELSLIAIILILINFQFHDLYKFENLFWGSAEFTRVFSSISQIFFILIIVSYLSSQAELSRIWLILSFFLGTLFVISGRTIFRFIIDRMRKNGRLKSRAVLVGNNKEAISLYEHTVNEKSGIDIVGCIYDKKNDVFDKCRWLGKTTHIKNIIIQYQIDTVLIEGSAVSQKKLLNLINDLRGQFVEIFVSSGLFNIISSRVLVKEVSGVPLISIKNVPLTKMNIIVKRSFDLFVSIFIIILFFPFFLIIILMIKISSPGSIFFKQERVGKYGKKFYMYKFRSMEKDADKKLDEIKHLNNRPGYVFKLKNDPRITKIGRLMRKYSIDECAQFINVLKGDMSIVGPRPPILSEVSNYNDWHWRRLDVTPGLTGLWQINGRAEVAFEEMVKLDIYYIENWSLKLDFSILFRTFPVVLTGKGAY